MKPQSYPDPDWEQLLSWSPVLKPCPEEGGQRSRSPCVCPWWSRWTGSCPGILGSVQTLSQRGVGPARGEGPDPASPAAPGWWQSSWKRRPRGPCPSPPSSSCFDRRCERSTRDDGDLLVILRVVTDEKLVSFKALALDAEKVSVWLVTPKVEHQSAGLAVSAVVPPGSRHLKVFPNDFFIASAITTIILSVSPEDWPSDWSPARCPSTGVRRDPAGGPTEEWVTFHSVYTETKLPPLGSNLKRDFKESLELVLHMYFNDPYQWLLRSL